MRTITTTILILLLAGHAAQAGVPQTVAIGVDTSNLSPKIAAEIQDSIATHVLHGLGEVLSNVARTRIEFIPIPDAKVEGQIRDCDGETCLQNIAQSATVDLVVRVKVQAKKAAKKGQSDYVVSLIVARAYPEREGWRDQSDCKNCGIAEIKHMASLVAGSIAEKIKIDAPLPPAPVPPPPLVAVAPAVPPLRPTIVKSPPPAQEGSRLWPWLTVGAGGVLAVTSVVLWTQSGNEHDCMAVAGRDPCRKKTVSWPAATVTGGLGLAGLVTGVIWLVRSGTEDPPTRVGLSPRGVVIEGSF